MQLSFGQRYKNKALQDSWCRLDGRDFSYLEDTPEYIEEFMTELSVDEAADVLEKWMLMML